MDEENLYQNRNQLSRKYHNKNYGELGFMDQSVIDGLLGLTSLHPRI